MDKSILIPRSNLLRVRFIPHIPPSILLGGFEYQCLHTVDALKEIGVDACLLDWQNSQDKFDILHLFGPSPNWYDICLHEYGRRPIVISAIAGIRGKHKMLREVSKVISKGTTLLRQQTTYGRIRDVLMMCDSVICLNELEKTFFTSFYNIPSTKIAVIPNGVPDCRFNSSPNIFTEAYGIRDFVLFVGNIVARKNPILLARILCEEKLPGIFIGGTLNSEKDYASEFARIVEQNPNLKWIPGLPYDHPLLNSAFAAASVLCMPSTGETQPLAAMEAMAAGTPVLLSDLPYAKQTPFENALRFSLSDLQSLRQLLHMVISSKDKYCVKLPKDYHWKQVALALRSVYLNLLQLSDAENS
jgi:glycosyltransferase involved in cell wall biosynthesis